VDRKTVAESFPSPAARRKAQLEIDEYHRFQKLSLELIAVNEKICRHRPVESEDSTWTPEEKNGCCDPSGNRPRNRPVAARALEAVEMMARSAMHRVAATGLTELLKFPAASAEQRTAPCSCGHLAHYQELPCRFVLTAVG
jgi:hypothetical protein